jgi:hypothetical protein
MKTSTKTTADDMMAVRGINELVNVGPTASADNTFGKRKQMFSREVDLKGASIVGTIAFLILWGYAIATYGWFLGLGVGWIPSIFIAILIALIWPGIWRGIAFLIVTLSAFVIVAMIIGIAGGWILGHL